MCLDRLDSADGPARAAVALFLDSGDPAPSLVVPPVERLGKGSDDLLGAASLHGGGKVGAEETALVVTVVTVVTVVAVCAFAQNRASDRGKAAALAAVRVVRMARETIEAAPHLPGHVRPLVDLGPVRRAPRCVPDDRVVAEAWCELSLSL